MAGGGYYPGNSVREKVWWAVKDMLAKNGVVNDVAVAAAVGNTMAESGCRTNNLEDGANSKSGMSDSVFTSNVDSGVILQDAFISNQAWSPYPPEKGGIYGYGLAQWTATDRKGKLWERTKAAGLSISDENAQITYLIDELNINSGSCYSVWKDHYDKWTKIYADDSNESVLKAKIMEATKHYCTYFEGGSFKRENQTDEEATRYLEAVSAYKDFHNKERPTTGPGRSIPIPENEETFVVVKHQSSITGKVFTVYKQNCNYPGYPETGKLFTGSDGGQCNRAAMCSIISGYFNGSAGELVSSFVETYISMGGTSAPAIERMFKRYGLNCSGTWYKSRQTITKDQVYNTLVNKKGYILFRVKNGDGVYGKSGTRWTGGEHWMAIIDYSEAGYMYISNSGNWSHTGDKLNNTRTSGKSGPSGWYPVDEFSATANVEALFEITP